MQPNSNQSSELLSALFGIPSTDPEYGQWWSSEDGQWLYNEICERIGIPLGLSSASKFGVMYEPEDVANTAVELLRAANLRPYIHAADDPWGYLAGMIKRRLNKETGMHLRVELNEESFRYHSYDADPESPTIKDAVEHTICDLARLVAPAKHKALAEAVWYFAERGHSRLSHLYTDATRDPELKSLGLGRTEILSIANAVLGSRPEHSHNSLLAGYLKAETFQPCSSIPHRLALHKFNTRFNSASNLRAAA